jgi:hypothetical protein
VSLPFYSLHCEAGVAIAALNQKERIEKETNYDDKHRTDLVPHFQCRDHKINPSCE